MSRTDFLPPSHANQAQYTPFDYPFTRSAASPLSSSPLQHSPSPARRILPNPFCPGNDDLILTFPKLSLSHRPVPTTSQPTSAYTSTDSEALSALSLSDWVEEPAHASPPQRPTCTTSPSLLTCLFQSRQSSVCSSYQQESSNGCTPMTPNMEGPCGRPILRRQSISTSTDSEALGGGLEDGPGLLRKRSSIKFAVRCTATSDSCASPQGSLSHRQPSVRRSASIIRPCLPICADEDEDEEENEQDLDDEQENHAGPSSGIRAGLSPHPKYEYEDSESDDEGYVEDEEDGFSSDGEPIGTYISSKNNTWARKPIFENPYTNRPVASPRTRPNFELPFQVTTDDCDAVPPPSPNPPRRGRKISIAVAKAFGKERCSRHLSPPPPDADDFTRELSPAPPAARSPSAAELCKRRARSCRSDDAPGIIGLGLRKLSVPPVSMGCSQLGTGKSILRTPSNPIASRRLDRTCMGGPRVGRRESAPAASCMKVKAEGSCSVGFGAKEGLEAMLRRKSTK